jgi:hypothetical protein
MSRWMSPSSSRAYWSASHTCKPTSTTAPGGSGRWSVRQPPLAELHRREPLAVFLVDLIHIHQVAVTKQPTDARLTPQRLRAPMQHLHRDIAGEAARARHHPRYTRPAPPAPISRSSSYRPSLT